jgi:cystathionine beta-lyase
MTQNLDAEVSRHGTNSLKWEFMQNEEDLFRFEHTDRFSGEDRILPMWVADMDFRCPEPVIDALIRRAQHGIYGYTVPGADFYEAVVHWMEKRHGWKIKAEWICFTPGVVPALNMLVKAFVSSGDGVLIQPPVYYPFYMAIENNEATVVANPLLYQDGRYDMDFEDLERKVRGPGVKMVILCSPHNPVGRVWTRDELMRFGRICIENGVLVVSDEIHSDLIYPGFTFTPFADLSPEFAQHSVICTAPSKTFNLAGLQTSCIIIPDHELRSRFKRTIVSNGLIGINCFGLVALQAAYEQGEEWLARVLAYIQGNYEYLESYLANHVPQIRVVRPEGTYLVWLDCRGLGLGGAALHELFMEKAGVYLDDGFIFGKEGEGFERINIACPRSILVEALDRIRKAVADLR